MQTDSTHPGYDLATGDAAEYCGVDRKTIRRWTDAGQLHAFITPGGHRRYRRSDLDDLLNGKASA